MIAIDEISGIYDHTDDCSAQTEMECNPRLPLNSELCEYALALLHKNVPLSLLCSECSTWAQTHWPGIPGTNTSHYYLTAHDVSSLYRSILHEHGIPQQTAAKENLDRWFHPNKPQLLQSWYGLLHYAILISQTGLVIFLSTYLI